MKSIKIKSADDAIKASNTNRGELINPEFDLSPNARLARVILLTIRNPREATLDRSKGNVELF
jgi:hypothetical protein